MIERVCKNTDKYFTYKITIIYLQNTKNKIKKLDFTVLE